MRLIRLPRRDRSIEDIDAPFLTATRATIQDGYLKVVSYATELKSKKGGIYETHYNPPTPPGKLTRRHRSKWMVFAGVLLRPYRHAGGAARHILGIIKANEDAVVGRVERHIAAARDKEGECRCFTGTDGCVHHIG